MIRQIAASLLLLFAALCIPEVTLACVALKAYTPIVQRSDKTLLFLADNCRGKQLFLFGTFHSDSPDLQTVVKQATPYLLKSRALWVEVASDPKNSQKLQQWLHLPADGPTLKQRIGNGLYREVMQKIAPILKLPEESINRLTPWALALLVQYPPPEADGVVLDVRLQEIAKRYRLPVYSLETLPQQFSIFTEMSESMQLDFLRATLEDFDQLQTMLDTLKQHYLKADLSAILHMSRAMFDDMHPRYAQLAAHLENRLIESRNQHMLGILLEKAGNRAFIAVGALHLPGESGLLHLLEAQGWQIFPLRQ